MGGFGGGGENKMDYSIGCDGDCGNCMFAVCPGVSFINGCGNTEHACTSLSLPANPETRGQPPPTSLACPDHVQPPGLAWLVYYNYVSFARGLHRAYMHASSPGA